MINQTQRDELEQNKYLIVTDQQAKDLIAKGLFKPVGLSPPPKDGVAISPTIKGMSALKRKPVDKPVKSE